MMDDKLDKYILLNDRVGEYREKDLLSKNIPIKFLRGELLEAFIEADQPKRKKKKDPENIALTRIAKKNQRLECPTSEVAKLTDSEADLLVAVCSAEERFRIYRERNRLELAKSLTVGDKVLVNLDKPLGHVEGIIRYIGTLPGNVGKMFGVERLDKEAIVHGTTYRTFGNQGFFDCQEDCDVFVAMDKIQPDFSTSPQRVVQSTQKSSTASSAISLGKKQKLGFNGTGKLKERQLFVCQEGYATPEVDFLMENNERQEISTLTVEYLDLMGLEIGCMVEVPMTNNRSQYGVIRWIGKLPDLKDRIVAGLELEQEKASCNDGVFRGIRYFTCPPGRGFFVNLANCKRDSRFTSTGFKEAFLLTGIVNGEVIADRNSEFQAHLAHVTSLKQVEQVLAHLKRNSRIAKAANNMLAYRICCKEKNSYLEEGRDDGESEAGKRLLHLLQVCKVEDVVVIVTHWYGGVCTGPDILKHINACALDVMKIATETGLIRTGAPTEIICRGPKALAAYQNALLNGTTKNRRLFLMLIGPSRAGKTSLLKSFRGDIFDPNEDSTDVIALHRYCCKLIDATWAKDSDNVDEISFESVMSTSVAKNYQTEEETHPGVHREKKSSGNYDDVTDIDYEVEKEAHLNVDREKKSSASTDDILDIDNEKKEEAHLGVIAMERRYENADDMAGHGNPENLEPKSIRKQHFPLSITETVRSVDDSPLDARIQEKILDALAYRKAAESDDIICTALDIGGQPVYDVTHPLFISSKGIFILVHNLENDAYSLSVPVVKKGNAYRTVGNKCLMTSMDHLEFWLSFVELNANHQTQCKSTECELMPKKLPPVFLACTHADKPFDGQNATVMSREILKHLKRNDHAPGEHVVSSLYLVDNTVSGFSEDEGVRELRKDICEIAKSLPHMNEVIPVRWFRFEKELVSLVEKEKYRYLCIEEAKQIALKCKVDVESDEFPTLLNYLHDIREIIYFKGTETVFIDIPWLVGIISKVIAVEPVENWRENQRVSWTKLENEGVLDLSLLEYVWREVADDHVTIDSLLVIMETFSLVCRWHTADKEEVFLVPAMLMNSSARDIAELLKDQMPPLIVDFPSSHLPLGIFPRLQVMLAELCNCKWSNTSQPTFHHNFCRFYNVGEEESFDLVLTSDIRTIYIGVINNNEADDKKVTDFCQEIIDFLKSKLNVDMRQDFPWMERMKYKLCIRCPICQPSADCCLPHVPGCVSPSCVHFITEEEVLKAKHLRCLKSPTCTDTKIPYKHFSHWFPQAEKSSPSKPVHEGPKTAPVGLISNTGPLCKSENSKRWVVVGVAIMTVLLPALRSFVLRKITKHYNDLRASDNIDTQLYGTRILKMDGTCKLNYESINNNEGMRPPLFDYKVKSEVDLAKLYLKPFMAKFSGIDESCDLSAVLGILSSSSVFTTETQDAAKDVRQHVRNEWGHCNFSKWDEKKIDDCFKFMDFLVKSLKLANDKEKRLLEELKEWETKGVPLCFGSQVDAGLWNLVHQNVGWLLKEVQSLKEKEAEEFHRVTSVLQTFQQELKQIVGRLTKIEEGQEDS